MFKNILNTLTSKIGIAALTFINLSVTSHTLGAEGRGFISIFIASMTFIILMNGLVGSSAIVFLTPRTNFYKLLLPSYLWAFFSSILCVLGIIYLPNLLNPFIKNPLYHFPKVPPNYIWGLWTFSLLGSLTEFNMMVALGKEKIKQYNIIAFIQIALLTSSLVFFLIILKQKNIDSFMKAMYFTYIFTFISSFYILFKQEEKIELRRIKVAIKAIVSYGVVDQLSNIILFLNNRSSYYFLLYYVGKKDIGVFSVAVTLSEAVFLITRSISMVQYSKVANTKKKEENVLLTIQLFKISTILLIFCTMCLTFTPTLIFEWIFGKDFTEISDVLKYIALSTIAIGSASILNHYFSGIGKFQYNVYATLLGLIVTITGCIYLIPLYGMVGAGITVSIANFLSCIYLFIIFKQQGEFSWKMFKEAKMW